MSTFNPNLYTQEDLDIFESTNFLLGNEDKTAAANMLYVEKVKAGQKKFAKQCSIVEFMKKRNPENYKIHDKLAVY